MRDREDKQIVFGRKPVLELIKSGKQVEKIFMQKGMKGPFEIEIRNLLKGKDIPVSMVHPLKLQKFTKGIHQGVVAFSSIVNYWKLDELVIDAFESGQTPLFLFLDGVTDVRNFGAIIRTAEVFGANGIIFPAKNSALVNQVMIKTSAGAIFNIPLARVNSMNNAIQYLQESGIAISVSKLDAEATINDIDFLGPTCIVMGSEELGVSAHMSKLADNQFVIPQFGKTDSLNVGVATGIILYEVQKQRSSLLDA